MALSENQIALKVTGLEEVNTKLAVLRDIGVKPQHIVKVKALRAGAKPITDEARRRAPSRAGGKFEYTKKAKRLGKKPYRLRQSIGTKFTTGSDRDSLNIRMIVRKHTGHLIEFGHKTKQGKRHVKRKAKSKYYYPKPGGKSFVGARPFMQPAVAAKSEASVNRVAEVINNELDKLIKAL